MKKLITLLLSLAFTSNAFGMEKDTNQNITDYTTVPFDVVAGLQENNKLLHEIKKQNRFIKKQNKTIIEQNYLHYQYVTELVENNSKHNFHSQKQYDLGSKIKETYIAQSLANDLEGNSSEEKK